VGTKALWIMEFYDILYNMSDFGVFPNFPFKAVCEARSEGLAPEETQQVTMTSSYSTNQRSPLITIRCFYYNSMMLTQQV